jgi:hypothetical protein
VPHARKFVGGDICDESHSLRDASTQKSTAVMNLVADHKWLVSGTFDVHEL